MVRYSSLIRLKDIKKAYHLGDEYINALEGVSLNIEQGEFVSIMGASGSGKSTLMNIIGCLDRPSAGLYWLDGKNVSQMHRNQLAEIRNRQLGFVFQTFNLLSRTSAIENVELPLLYTGVGTRERRRRSEEALRCVGLTERMDHYPNQLSGGQQQRVAIARALVTNPKIILADEPTGNLDSRTSLEIMAIFQRLWYSGITLVLVTHEPDIATFAARVLVMKDGMIRTDQNQQPVIVGFNRERTRKNERTADLSNRDTHVAAQ